jgi:hypothetical protein
VVVPVWPPPAGIAVIMSGKQETVGTGESPLEYG